MHTDIRPTLLGTCGLAFFSPLLHSIPFRAQTSWRIRATGSGVVPLSQYANILSLSSLLLYAGVPAFHLPCTALGDVHCEDTHED
ncbi:hypothetical protein BC826DRAFT_1057552 [Russula brevipes]|nr:hypothetical protein BC826DRAFT_1057552 [Russula brevipes]